MYIVVTSRKELFCKGIHYMIAGMLRKVIVDEVRAEEALHSLLSDVTPTILIVDCEDPQLNGYELCQFVRNNYPQIKIISFVETSDQDQIIPLLELEVDGYLSFDVRSEELEKCLNRVGEGKKYYDHQVASLMHYQIAKANQEEQLLQQLHLSKREQEILSLVCRQYTSKEIGDLLNISQRTVDGHRHRLIRKCQVKNTAGLIYFAVDKGLFQETLMG